MRRIMCVFAFVLLTSTVALAESWSGSLLDATCYTQQFQQSRDQGQAADACPATSETSSFALLASDTVYGFDANGNTRAKAALMNRADRSQPGQQQATKIAANVEGTESSGTIQVERIEIQ